MEKVKIDMTAKPEVWTGVTLEDGVQVKVRNYLPYAEREDALDMSVHRHFCR